MALEDLGVDRIAKACELAIKRLKWFPKPAELRELVQQPLDDPEFRATQAWILVMQNAVGRVVHKGRPLDFSDPIINGAVRGIGGLDYIALEGTDSDHERYTRPRFRKEYLRLDAYEMLHASICKPLRSRVTRSNEALRIECGWESAPRIGREPSPLANELANKLHVDRPKKDPKPKSNDEQRPANDTD